MAGRYANGELEKKRGRMPKGAQKFSDYELAKVLRTYNGLISPVARHFGVNYNTVLVRVRNSQKLTMLQSECRETIIDLAENQLINRVRMGKWDAVEFTLRTIGKNRGYTEKTEVENTGEVKVSFDKQDEGL